MAYLARSSYVLVQAHAGLFITTFHQWAVKAEIVKFQNMALVLLLTADRHNLSYLVDSIVNDEGIATPP